MDSSLSHMKNRVQGCGGIISVDKDHNVGIAHTTNYMPWAKISDAERSTDTIVEYGMHQDECIKLNLNSC